MAAAPLAAAIAVQAAARQLAALVAELGAAVAHLRARGRLYARRMHGVRRLTQLPPMHRTQGTCWTGRPRISDARVHRLAAHDSTWVSGQRRCTRGAVCGGLAR